MYDILIRNGTLIDGSGAAARKSDIAIIGDRIAAIGNLSGMHAARTIDATGRVVCPGFIDLHTHSDFTLALDGRAFSSLTQGITTQIMGNCGVSAAPARDHELYYGPLDRNMTQGLECDWSDFHDYFSRLEQQGIGTNTATLVGHGNVRVAAMGFDNRRPSPREMALMIDLTEQAMEHGCFGMSSGLAYAPGPYADIEELIALGRVVARHGGLYTSHIRNQTESIAAAVEEVVDVGRNALLPAHVSHMQPGTPMLGATSGLLEKIDALRAAGIDVSCDAVPYTVGSTALKALLPPWALEGGDDALVARLRDPEQRKRIKDDTILHGAESGGSRKRNLVKNSAWNKIWLGSGQVNAHLIGKDFVEIGRIRRQDPHDALLDIIIEDAAQPLMLAEDVSEEDILNIARHPAGGIISDGFSLVPEGILAEGKHHPRSYGAFPYFLRRFVRENREMTWEWAIHKLTGHAAARFGLTDRGLLREGLQADLVVFDAERIRERATYESPYRYSEGIDLVFVNGRLACEAGEPSDVRAGRVLRHRSEGVKQWHEPTPELMAPARHQHGPSIAASVTPAIGGDPS